MPQPHDITPLVLTYNEAANIERTLSRLTWAHQVIVLDSFSTDETPAICRRFPNVEFVQRAFDDHTTQWNHGLDRVRTPWVLSLDADYVLGDAVIEELLVLPADSAFDGYAAAFTYCVFGRPLRASLYPPRVVLFRRERCRYEVDGHTQRLNVTGSCGSLAGRILHDDRKTLDRWLAEQARYAAHEAAHLANARPDALNTIDRIRRKVVIAPALILLYTLVGKGLALDGWSGWYYALQRTIAELLLSLRLVDDYLRRRVGHS